MSYRYFKSLMMKSAIVQVQIDEESKRRLPDTIRLLMLKKQRLYILDKIQTLRKRARERKRARLMQRMIPNS